MIDPKDFCSSLSKLGVDFFAGVPDSLLKHICAYISDNFPEEKHKITANEGSAIGLAMGYYMSSKKLPLVYMQNSGLGNAINPLTSLADRKVYSIPMMLMIGWRGEPGVRDEPQHVQQGMITKELLTILGIPFEVIDKTTSQSEVVKILNQLNNKALEDMCPVAVLVRKDTFSAYEMVSSSAKINHRNRSGFMSRTEVIDHYVKLQKSHVVVATTGVTSRELLQIRRKEGHNSSGDFLTVGGMGHASQIALGISMNKPETKIICLDGDGSLLMHMGALASIADSGCKNYYYILLNNSVHDSVGGQPIGAKAINFLKIAESSGFNTFFKIDNPEQLMNLESYFEKEGPVFIEIMIKPGFPSDLIRPEKSPQENKEVFERFLQDCN